MRGETEMKRAFQTELKRVWKVANRLTGSRLRYPQLGWFHIKGDSDSNRKQEAGYALGREKISLCIEYAYFFREMMFAVLIHEVAHCFADYLNRKRGIYESMHGKEWRKIATKIAYELDCYKAVANHAYHCMQVTPQQIAFCKKRISRKRLTKVK